MDKTQTPSNSTNTNRIAGKNASAAQQSPNAKNRTEVGGMIGFGEETETETETETPLVSAEQTSTTLSSVTATALASTLLRSQSSLKRKAAQRPSIIDPPTSSPDSSPQQSPVKLKPKHKNTNPHPDKISEKINHLPEKHLQSQNNSFSASKKLKVVHSSPTAPTSKSITAFFSVVPASHSLPKPLFSISPPIPTANSTLEAATNTVAANNATRTVAMQSIDPDSVVANSQLNTQQVFISSLVQIQNGKVVFKEKKMAVDRLPITISGLRLVAQLFPDVEDDEDGEREKTSDVISDMAISKAIQAIASRRNYGLEVNGIQPAACSIWRWEVTDKSMLGEFKDRFETRCTTREQAGPLRGVRSDISSIYASFSEAEKVLCLGKFAKPRKLESLATPTSSISSPKTLVSGGTFSAKEKKEQDRIAVLKVKEELKEKKEQEKREAKEAKEEAKRKKEEEKSATEKAKEEQKQRKDEERLKAEKTQPSIFSFVTKIKKEVPKHVHTTDTDTFSRAAIKSMDEEYRSFLKIQSNRYKETAQAKRVARKTEISVKLLNARTDADEDQDIPDQYTKYRGLRWKLLQFAEDLRPPYFGTWTKKSGEVNGRRPWGRDVGGVLDYSVDSEAEWEEDEVGEELGSEIGDEDDGGGVGGGPGSGGEQDGDEMDDWLVPDGYLSEDEAENDEDAGIDRKVVGKSISNQKKKVGPLIPVIVCSFGDENSPDAILDSLQADKYKSDTEKIDPFKFKQESSIVIAEILETPNSQHQMGVTPTKNLAKALKSNGEKYSFNEKNIEPFIRLISGSILPMSKLVDSIKEHFPTVTKVQLELKIRQVSEKKKVVPTGKAQWVIKPEFSKYCDSSLETEVDPSSKNFNEELREDQPDESKASNLKRKATH
ncbi:hypothetical protein HK100_002388 [Physocladia obscura]|uniref:Chromatin assembly factor 1 subunit A n=1 Tax=Physocladia obscura TaxID=109957 RepID=A0AAD5SWG6_9FUNG|nr:hypothetical protein HK100_002388 [Physocladia obscura]